MEHQQTTEPTPTGEPIPGHGHGRGERCSSVVGRWRCARPRGHAGLHAAQDEGGRTTWNDNASGRRLREL
jgi:hypothetical protein